VIWCVRQLLFSLVVLCFQQILAFGLFTVVPAVQAQEITADPNALPPGYHAPLNIACYHAFFALVGAEHDLIEREQQQGKQVTAPTDYSSKFGIDNGTMNTILGIALDAYHQTATAKKQFEEARSEYNEALLRGNTQGLAKPDPRPSLATEGTILNTAWVGLKQALSPDDFQKFDASVCRNSIWTRSPGQGLAEKQESQPFPRDVAYKMFFLHVANEDARVARDLQEGKPGFRQNYSKAAHFPQEEELPVRAILLAAERRLEENRLEQKRIWGEWTGQYGRESLKMSPPPEFQAAQKEEDTIVQETIAKLNQVLGQDSFNNFDSWITRHYGSGQIIGAPSTDPNTIPK
jgi:hypothetical protein